MDLDRHRRLRLGITRATTAAVLLLTVAINACSSGAGSPSAASGLRVVTTTTVFGFAAATVSMSLQSAAPSSSDVRSPPRPIARSPRPRSTAAARRAGVSASIGGFMRWR